MSDSKEVKADKAAAKAEAAAAEKPIAEPTPAVTQSPLDEWLDNLPKRIAAMVTVDSSKERHAIATALVAELEALRKPAA